MVNKHIREHAPDKWWMALVFVCLSAYAVSQVPDYFANDPHWYEVESADATSCGYIILEHYYAQGDTLIDAHLYQKIMKEQSDYTIWYGTGAPPDDCNSLVTSAAVVHGYYRQEGRQVIRYNTGTNSDDLYRDFDLVVGDTVFYSTDYGLCTVVAIDSVLFGSEYRRVYSLTGANYGGIEELVEGVGFNTGFFEWTPFGSPGIGKYLQCYLYDGIGVYPFDSNCSSPLSVDQDINNAPEITVFPNPAIDEIILTASTQNRVEKIQLIDISGRQLGGVVSRFRSSDVQIDISRLVAGTYLILVTFDDGRSKSVKVVKQ